MEYERYKKIDKMVHVANNNSKTKDFDPLYKIRPIIDILD